MHLVLGITRGGGKHGIFGASCVDRPKLMLVLRKVKNKNTENRTKTGGGTIRTMNEPHRQDPHSSLIKFIVRTVTIVRNQNWIFLRVNILP